MKTETEKALQELGRAAARYHGIPDDVEITMTTLRDRDAEWCGNCGDCPQCRYHDDEFFYLPQAGTF